MVGFALSKTSAMVDTFSKSVRSQIMRSVHSKGTSPERKCEAVLRSLRISFQRDVAKLPGRPDFLMKRSRLALFVHGCFWHGHRGCKQANLPSSNVRYWNEKIGSNRRRDRRVREALRKSGWRTAVIWECKLRDTGLIARRLIKLTRGHVGRKELR